MDFDLAVAKRYITLHDRARDKKIDFNLTLSDVRNVMKVKRCPFTGVDIGGKVSIDRLDPEQGYVRGNIVACDRDFNMKKGNLTPKEILGMYRVLKRRRIVG